MSHSGAFLMGTGTSVKSVPSARIGIVVLTNGAPGGAAESVVAEFIDMALYGKPVRDWFAAYNGVMKGFFEPQADLSGQEKPANPAPGEPIKQYTGRFANPYYGTAEIKDTNGTLTLILGRSEEHTSELQSLMRISYAVFCLKKKNTKQT